MHRLVLACFSVLAVPLGSFATVFKLDIICCLGFLHFGSFKRHISENSDFFLSCYNISESLIGILLEVVNH